MTSLSFWCLKCVSLFLISLKSTLNKLEKIRSGDLDSFWRMILLLLSLETLTFRGSSRWLGFVFGLSYFNWSETLSRAKVLLSKLQQVISKTDVWDLEEFRKLKLAQAVFSHSNWQVLVFSQFFVCSPSLLLSLFCAQEYSRTKFSEMWFWIQCWVVSTTETCLKTFSPSPNS